MKKLIIRLLIILVLLGAGLWAYRYVRQLPQRKESIPVAVVRQGDVMIRAFARGELRALRSESIIAPNLFGTVQVTQLAPMGAFAKEKDLIVAFDDSDVLSRIEEGQLNLESTDESIKRQEAELAIRNNQDKVQLLTDQYDVRRAELQVKRNELLSDIDKRKNVLALEQAKRTLTQFESDMKARREQAEAALALSRQLRARAQLELRRDQARLRMCRQLCTMSGLVSIRQNMFGGSRQFGAEIPDIREGDQVHPGMPVADVLDLSEVEVAAKVGELDRANLVEGQDAVIQLDALAGKKIQGKIKSMSGTATANVWAGDPSKKFEVTFSVNMQELLTAVGAAPEQIRQVLATAEKNRNRPVSRMAMASLLTMGAASQDLAGGSPNATFSNGQDSGFDQAGMNGGQQGAAMGQAGGQQDAAMGQAGGRRRGGAQGGSRARATDGEQAPGATAQSGGRGSPGGGQRSGDAAGGRQGAPGFPTPGMGFFGGGRGGARFSDQDLAAAKLPPPPEEDTGLQVLLRPGLLADIEIVVENIPDAIHIPAQAVFEREGKPVVYVKRGDRFEERAISLAKRSESTMVIAAGLKPGEEVALSNPTRGPSKKQEKGKSGGASPMAAPSGAKS